MQNDRGADFRAARDRFEMGFKPGNAINCIGHKPKASPHFIYSFGIDALDTIDSLTYGGRSKLDDPLGIPRNSCVSS